MTDDDPLPAPVQVPQTGHVHRDGAVKVLCWSPVCQHRPRRHPRRVRVRRRAQAVRRQRGHEFADGLGIGLGLCLMVIALGALLFWAITVK